MAKSNKMIVAVAALAAGIAAGVTSASALTVLSDNFNASSPTLNWGGDAIFASGGTTATDLVGPGNYGQLVVAPASGNVVDLNGTTGHLGDLTSVSTLAAGSYTLTFLLAGPAPNGPSDPRSGATATTTISVGGVVIDVLSPTTNSPYTLYTVPFTTAGGKLEFAETAASNKYIGDLLDDVTVASSGVPEPSTWAMMLLGFAGLGFAGYRSSRARLTLRA